MLALHFAASRLRLNQIAWTSREDAKAQRGRDATKEVEQQSKKETKTEDFIPSWFLCSLVVDIHLFF